MDHDEQTSFLDHVKKLPDSGNGHGQVIAWSYDMAGHAKKCVERSPHLLHRAVVICQSHFKL